MTYMRKKVVLVKKTNDVNYTYVKPHAIYTTKSETDQFNHK